MKNLLLSICFLLFFTINYSYSQDLEDVTLEMLRESKPLLDSTVGAEVLYERGEVSLNIDDSWEYEFQVVRRVKVYNQDGYDQADIQIPYFVGNSNSDREKVSSINGYVYYEEDGKIEKEKIRGRDVFDVDLSDLWEAKKFTLPKIQDGVILEYSYKINSPHVNNLPEWVFQNKVPTRQSEYVTKIPVEYLAYNLRSKGYFPFETSTEEDNGSLYVRGARGPVRTAIRTTRHVGKDLPKIENESYVNNIKNYLPSVTYELSSYKMGPSEAHKFVSRSWDDVVKTLSESDTYKKELTRANYFKDDLQFILSGESSPKDKMNAIFNFLKKRMTWNEEERRYASDKLDKIYEERVGNSADINIMLTAMLREAGLDANPVLSSTISNGIPFFPTISGFNYVLTHVDINGESFILDATSKYSSPNIPPLRVLNWKGTILKPQGFESLDLMPDDSSSKVYQVLSNLTAEGEIQGQCRIVSKERFAWESRNSLHKKSEEELKLKYEKKYSLSDIKDISTLNQDDVSKALIEGFSFSERDQFVENIGDKIYLSPMLFLNLKDNPFKKEERLYPVDFLFTRNIKHFITIKIPQGYKVEYLPEAGIFKLGDGVALLSYLIEFSNNTINVKVDTQINTEVILPQDYQSLKEFYSSLFNKENEKIVLVKS